MPVRSTWSGRSLGTREGRVQFSVPAHIIGEKTMHIIRPGGRITNANLPSIFLAGPSPREDHSLSWRPTAIEKFRLLGFKGQLFIPEPWSTDWEGQVEWEDKHLNIAKCILFWIPRELSKMPGFTTNIEWGKWNNSGKVVLGAPEDAPNMRYIRYYADKYNVPQATSLIGTIKHSLITAHKG